MGSLERGKETALSLKMGQTATPKIHGTAFLRAYACKTAIRYGSSTHPSFVSFAPVPIVIPLGSVGGNV